MKNIALPALTAAALILTSCAGYHTGVSKPHQLAKVTKLAVPTFKNDTLIPRLEVLATDALIKNLQIAGTYKIVPVSEADAVLRANIVNITRHQYRADRNNTLRTSELQVGLIVRYKVEGADGEVLLSGQARDQSQLVLDPNFQVTQAQALAVAAEHLSATVASDLTEGW